MTGGGVTMTATELVSLKGLLFFLFMAYELVRRVRADGLAGRGWSLGKGIGGDNFCRIQMGGCPSSNNGGKGYDGRKKGSKVMTGVLGGGNGCKCWCRW